MSWEQSFYVVGAIFSVSLTILLLLYMMLYACYHFPRITCLTIMFLVMILFIRVATNNL